MEGFELSPDAGKKSSLVIDAEQRIGGMNATRLPFVSPGIALFTLWKIEVFCIFYCPVEQ